MILGALALLCVARSSGVPSVIGPSPSQRTATQDLIVRIVGQEAAGHFMLSELSRSSEVDTFELQSSEGADGSTRIEVSGNSGVALASGFYHYLRWKCNSSVSWGVNGTGIVNNLPNLQKWPAIPQKVRVSAQAKISYYMQPCTESYTSAFWDAEDWSFEVDWMALHGISHPFVAVGVEAIWVSDGNSYSLYNSLVIYCCRLRCTWS